MFRKLFIALLIASIALQAGRDAITGLWFWVNQNALSERYCINKEEPVLMCHGKCYLKQVMDEEKGRGDEAPWQVPSSDERLPFLALPTATAGLFLPGSIQTSTTFFYLFPAGQHRPFSLLKPPKG